VITLIYLLIGGLSALIYGGVTILVSKTKIQMNLILKIFSVILFVVYMFRLFTADAIDNTYFLFGGDSTTWLFPFGKSLWMIFLRWMTYLLLAVAIVGPFFPQKVIKQILGYFGTAISILNVIFFKSHIIGFIGTYEPLSYRGIQFAIEIVILAVICSLYLTNLCKSFLKNKEIPDLKKQITTFIGVFAWLLLAYMPQALLENLFGHMGIVPEDFNLSHRLVIYITFFTMLFTYFIMRSKTQADKNLFFALVSLSGFFQYFYVRRYGLGGLPLHLCNTAIIMMFFAFVFKMKGVFYFSYFVNVLGAFCAIILPNYSTDLFDISTLHYWYNHYYAFVLPILGVALRVFPRPNIKMMYKAIGIFTLYFVLVAILNAWFNNYTSTDYFFLYSDFLSGKFGLEALQYTNVITLQIQGLTFRFFYLFQIGVYLVFIVLMFVTWAVYDALFKVADHHYDLLVRIRMNRMDMLKLKESLGGRKMSEKVVQNSTEMIKVTHFTKRYGSSNVKAVDDFSITIHGGEVFGFLGHNGAGKSTTIKSLVGIQSITEGEMFICGYNIKTQPLEAKLNIGYVSDNHAVYEKLTGREYINYVADLYLVSKADRDERLAYYLQRFALTDAIDQEIKSYSHGMKQKLVVISSLIHDPKVWILDEPLTGLDPTSSYQIKECMREHANKGNTVFFSSHVIEVVEKICDRIAIISHGKLEGVWSIKELHDSGTSLEELYLKYVDLQEKKLVRG
jgi:ABC-2 type transport system ATP-binding protein